jgi:lipid-binding SYLF domain-containing protein
MSDRKAGGLMAWLVIALLFSITALAEEGDAERARRVVDGALSTFKSFSEAPEIIHGFGEQVKQAQAVFIMPSQWKGGLLFGGSGGTGVFLVRDKTTGQWSEPAFYTLGSGTFGLQIGLQKSELVLLVMTEKGADAFLSTSFQLGGNVGFAAGPKGKGEGAANTDILVYQRSKGAFAGAVFEGAVVAVRDNLNHAYYGEAVSPSDILVRGTVFNPQALELKRALATAAGD